MSRCSSDVSQVRTCNYSMSINSAAFGPAISVFLRFCDDIVQDYHRLTLAGGVEFFCEGLRFVVPGGAGFVAIAGCCVQPLLRMPGPAGPVRGPMPE
jgi:hypothetical protein